MAIQSFADKASRAFFETGKPGKAPWSNLGDGARRILDMVSYAMKLNDLKAPPGNRLVALSGKLSGKHSIRINNQYRIVFKWEQDKQGVSEVKITDYHWEEYMLPTHRKPTPPGWILFEEFLEPLEISQSDFAKHLGGSWTQPKLNAIISGKRSITEAIALDFADALETSAEFWMGLQTDVYLWEAKQRRSKIFLEPRWE